MPHQNLFVGIDISKFKHDIAVMNHEKILVHKLFVIKNSYMGYQYLSGKLQWLKEKYQTKTFRIGMEATGDYWKNLFHFLNQQLDDSLITVINPIQTHAFANTELRRAKTDPINAKDIALFMIEKQPRVSRNLPMIFDFIKDLDKQIHSIKKLKTISINRLRIELTKTAPEIESAFKNFNAKQLLAILEQFPTAQEINQASVEDLRNIRYDHKQWRVEYRVIHKIKTVAQNSIAYKQGQGAGLVVKSLIRQIRQFHQEINQLNNEIKELYALVNKQNSLLATIPGISPETAIVLEAYIGDIHRFPDVRKFVAFFGMNPIVCQSGKSVKRTSKLQKKGSGAVRCKLFMAVLAIIATKEGRLYKYYCRLVDAGKEKLVAIGATMRKLLEIIYAMLKTNEPFNPQK